jgi:anti-sigma factor RsiW
MARPRLGMMADRGESGREGRAVGGDSEDAGVPVTPRLLADLQAGLLDDDTAARVRRQAREDPQAERMVAALDKVRRDLAELGSDAASAADVPDDVADRVAEGLRASRATPTHAARRPADRARTIVACIGAAAALAAVAVGSVMLFRTPAGTPSTSPTIESLTVDPSPGAIPLSKPQILGLATQRPDFGQLVDPQRRASCLSGLGYASSTTVVGARQLVVNGRPGILLLLSGAAPQTYAAVVVAPSCSSADTGLLAETVVART